VELLSLMSPLDCDATSSDRNSRPAYVEDIRGTVIRFSLMRFLSRLTVNNIFSGALWIKMVRSLMFFCRIDEMLMLQSDSSNEC
jgi:hypothetical protein